MDCGLEGKTVFLTGGSAGIGRATALAYAREPGVRVAISYLNHQAEAQETVELIQAAGLRAMAVPLDLGKPETIETAIGAISAEFGGVDVLINNAVQWPMARFNLEDGAISEWDSFFATNLSGIVRLCQLVIPGMKAKRWGRIVLLSSDLAIHSMPGSGRYSALKAALFGLNSNLVAELSPFGILSNVVLPSWTLTDRARTQFPASFQEVAVKAFPTARVTTPEDVASLLLYLGSGANGHVNGEHIKVTGGCSLQLMTHLWDEARAQAGK